MDLVQIAFHGTSAEMRQAIENGANPNMMCTSLYPLGVAIVKGDAEMVRTLLDCGASPLVGSVVGASPGKTQDMIELAVSHKNLEIVLLLLANSPTTLANRTLETSILYGFAEGVDAALSALYSGYLDLDREFLHSRLPPQVFSADSPASFKTTPLGLACSVNDCASVTKLLSAGADVNKIFNAGTALAMQAVHVACAYACSGCLDLLLSAGAEKNGSSLLSASLTTPPLLMACKSDARPDRISATVQVLFTRGASGSVQIDAQDQRSFSTSSKVFLTMVRPYMGYTALMWASKRGNHALVQYLLGQGANKTLTSTTTHLTALDIVGSEMMNQVTSNLFPDYENSVMTSIDPNLVNYTQTRSYLL